MSSIGGMNKRAGSQAYMSPWARSQQEKERKRARDAAKRMNAMRLKANKDAPHSASSSANKVHGWNSITLTNKVFDTSVKKVDIFRLRPKDNASYNPAEKENTQTRQIADAMGSMLNDSRVHTIFKHKQDDENAIHVPQSVVNLKRQVLDHADISSRNDADALPEFNVLEEQHGAGSMVSSAASSPRSSYNSSPLEAKRHHHPPLSTGSPRASSGSTGATSPRSRSQLTPRSHSSVHTPRSELRVGFEAERQSMDQEIADKNVSPIDLAVASALAGDTPPSADGRSARDLHVPIPPYPYAGLEALPELVTAITGLVSQLEKSPMSGPQRRLSAAGQALEDELLFPHRSTRKLRADAVSPVDKAPSQEAMEKRQARLLLADKVTEHLHSSTYNKLSTTDDCVSNAIESSSSSTKSRVSPLTSIGGVRDMILSKLQAVEAAHVHVVEALLHPPDIAETSLSSDGTGGSFRGVSPRSDAGALSSTIPADVAEYNRLLQERTNATDEQKLELAVHRHPTATALPTDKSKKASGLSSAFRCVHTGKNDVQKDDSNILQFTQNVPAPSLRAHSGRDVPGDLYRSWQAEQVVTSEQGGDGSGEENARSERKVHFDGALRAPCHGNTFETALRAASGASANTPVLPVYDTKGGIKEFGTLGNAKSAWAGVEYIKTGDEQLLAMREQRRKAMSHLRKLPAPAPVVHDFKEWKKSMSFARDMRNLSLESRGISHSFYMNRATELVVNDIVATVCEEVEAALDEEVSKFVSRI